MFFHLLCYWLSPYVVIMYSWLSLLRAIPAALLGDQWELQQQAYYRMAFFFSPLIWEQFMDVEHFLFRFSQQPNPVNGKSQQQQNVMEETECLMSKYIIVKLLSCKLCQSCVPFNLFISGYTLSLFPFANESCVPRSITSGIRNAGLLISDIWKELK